MLKSSVDKSPQGATKGAETPKKEENTLEKYIGALSPAARKRLERDRARRKAKAAQAKAIKAKADKIARAAKAKADAAAAEAQDFLTEVKALAKAASRRVVRHRRNEAAKVARLQAREGIKAARRGAALLRAEAQAARAQAKANDRALALVTLPAPGWQPRCVSTTPRAGIVGMAQAIADGVGMVLRAEAAKAQAQDFLVEVRAAVAQVLKAALRARKANRKAEAKVKADKDSAAKAKATGFRGNRIGRPMEFVSPVKGNRDNFLTDAGYTREEAAHLAKVRKAKAAQAKAEREALAQARAELKALRAIQVENRRKAMEALAGLRNAVRRALRARNAFQMNASGLVGAIKAVRNLGLEPRGAVLSEIVLLGYGDLVA